MLYDIDITAAVARSQHSGVFFYFLCCHLYRLHYQQQLPYGVWDHETTLSLSDLPSDYAKWKTKRKKYKATSIISVNECGQNHEYSHPSDAVQCVCVRSVVTLTITYDNTIALCRRRTYCTKQERSNMMVKCILVALMWCVSCSNISNEQCYHNSARQGSQKTFTPRTAVQYAIIDKISISSLAACSAFLCDFLILAELQSVLVWRVNTGSIKKNFLG